MRPVLTAQLDVRRARLLSGVRWSQKGALVFTLAASNQRCQCELLTGAMYVLCRRCYEAGSTGSMAEKGSVCELEGLENQLQSLSSRYTSDELRADSEPFCSDFCKVRSRS